MATFAVQQIGYTGADPTFSAPVAFPDVNAVGSASERQFLWMKNSDGSNHDTIVVVPGQTFGQAHPDVTVSIPAGGEKLIGPLNKGLYDPVSAIVWVTSVITGLTCAVLELPQP